MNGKNCVIYRLDVIFMLTYLLLQLQHERDVKDFILG